VLWVELPGGGYRARFGCYDPVKHEL
jgi:hypothetical protein